MSYLSIYLYIDAGKEINDLEVEKAKYKRPRAFSQHNTLNYVKIRIK
jgi:hypothetical protein